MFRRLLLSIMTILVIVGVALPLYQVNAQSSTITLSIAVPRGEEDTFNDKFVSAYEADHPGIKLNLVEDIPSIPPAASDLTKHFDAVEKYVQLADVLPVDMFSLSPEATRAGYFLDLAPLVNEDKSINTDDFNPVVWQSFQWDKGIWGIPTSADAIVLVYKPTAFDKANLPYPSDKWTLDDLENAVRTLAVKDSSGKVTDPGIDISPFIQPYLLRIASDTKLYDENTIPNTPKLDIPAVAALLDRWKKLDDEGYVGQSFNKAPISINAAVNILVSGVDKPEDKFAGVMLPGGKAALSPNGFAVSAGTQYPQQAYDFVSWLTTRPEIVDTGVGSIPVRKSMIGKTSDRAIKLNISPEVKALIDQATTNGIPFTELRFTDYLAVAYNKMKTDNLDASAALQAAESVAVKAQSDAVDRKDKIKGSLVVATPVPQANSGGKATIKFGISGVGFGGYPNKDQWDKLVSDFTASDPQVGSVVIEGAAGNLDFKKLTQTYDCFYLPYSAVQTNDFTSLLSVDPYISADSTFDKSDIASGVLAQVTRDNKIYALPADIQPTVLKLDLTKFQQAGVAKPEGIWTIDQFQDTLNQLRPDPKGDAPFAPSNTFGSYLFSMIAAYGGIPLDYRTNPVTINYTDPKTVNAIRQVLDLAKNHYIKYLPLAGNQLDFVMTPPDAPITHDSFSLFSLRSLMGGGSNNADAGKFGYTLYPKGKDFSAVTYNLGTLNISATTQQADACYRFISAVSRNGTVFTGMPARRSVLNDPTLAKTQGDDVVKVYKDIDQLLQEPTTLSIPVVQLNGLTSDFFIRRFLFKVFDDYVLNDKDLEAGLKDAELQGKALDECVNALPTADMSTTDGQKAYLRGFRDCAVKADPSLKPLFDALKLD